MRDEFNGVVRFVIQDLENFRFSTLITVLPFFRKIEFFSGFIPPSREEELGRKRLEADGDGDSFLFNVGLAAGMVSSILRDSNLKRLGALPVEEALALSL